MSAPHASKQARSKKQSARVSARLSFDAFLFQSFGGPNEESDIIPFLENVTRGRNIPAERVEKVSQQYKLVGGKSPINGINQDLISRIQIAFEKHGIDLPIYFGNRNFAPYVYDALEQMKRDGRTKVIAFVTSAYGSFSGCKQYKIDIELAQQAVGAGAPEVVKIRHYYSHPGFIGPLISNTIDALNVLPNPCEAELIFTAHSIPLAMSNTSPYLQQLNRAVALVASGVEQRTGLERRYHLAFQSRSGPPTQKWLEPDVSDQLRTLADAGVRNIALIPVSFVSDHMEVVYDLDILAARTARELGVSLARAKTSSDSPEFVEMIVDLTMELLDPSTAPKSLGDFDNLNGCSASCCPTRP